MVAQEQGPLALRRGGGRLRQDVDHGEPVLLAGRHEHAGHEGEVEGHVAGVAPAHVRHGVLGPLIGLGQQHPIVEATVDVGPELPEKGEGLGKVLACRSLAGIEVRHRVEPETVDAHRQPVVHDVEHGLAHGRVVVVEAGLVRVEAVPEVGLGHGIERPVRRLEVLEDDAGPREAVRGVAPDVEIAVHRPGLGQPGPLEPRVLVGGVRQHQFGDDPDAASMRFAQEHAEVAERAVGGVHLPVVRNVIPVVAQRGGVERQQPQRGDPELLQVVELVDQAAEVPDAVAVAVMEGTDVDLVDDRVLVPAGGRPAPARRCRRARRPSAVRSTVIPTRSAVPGPAARGRTGAPPDRPGRA